MPESIRVVPAILTDNPKTLETMIRQSETFTDYVQIDIMDGKFVPSRSIMWEQMVGLNPKLNWEVHLMVQQPEDYLADFKKVGARKVIFHFEATSSHRDVIQLARRLRLKVGIAINPETPVSAVLPLTGDVDSVLFLSVHPGFYGAKFIPEVLDKVVELRRSRPGVEIGIDGGMKEGNIAQVARSGVDVIFVGSAIFLQPDPGESYRHLMKLAQEGAQQNV